MLVSGILACNFCPQTTCKSDQEHGVSDSHMPYCRYLIRHTNLFVAWLFNLVYSMALVFLSTWCVVNKAPQAAGAGVAEVMAYLNGCQLPKVWAFTEILADRGEVPMP